MFQLFGVYSRCLDTVGWLHNCAALVASTPISVSQAVRKESEALCQEQRPPAESPLLSECVPVCIIHIYIYIHPYMYAYVDMCVHAGFYILRMSYRYLYIHIHISIIHRRA